MKITKDFIIRNIAGECILVPTGSTAKEFNGMISLSPTGRFIWENIEKTSNFDGLISLITNEYDIDTDTARQETAEFIGKLLASNLIDFTLEDKSW